MRNTISFIPASSDFLISATEVNYKQSGVFRNLVNLKIALYRSLCLPARMAIGCLYQIDSMAMLAGFEAYIGGHWYTFHAAKTVQKGKYAAVSKGLGAADVAVFNQLTLTLLQYKK